MTQTTDSSIVFREAIVEEGWTNRFRPSLEGLVLEGPWVAWVCLFLFEWVLRDKNGPRSRGPSKNSCTLAMETTGTWNVDAPIIGF